MKIRSLILIVLIVLLPLSVLAWFAVRIAKDDASVTQQRFRSLMEQRLQDVNLLVARQFSETQRRLEEVTTLDDFSIGVLRERVRLTPQVTQIFVLTPNGELLYPNPAGALNRTEESFLRQTGKMFADRDLQNSVAQAAATADPGDFAPANGPSSQTPNQQRTPTVRPGKVYSSGSPEEAYDSTGSSELQSELRRPQQASAALPASSGWFVWYWDRGLNLVYWQRRPGGHVVGAALERSRWIADVISILPETVEGPSTSDQLGISWRVVNAASDTVYEWGPEIESKAAPFCEIPVTAPLASWRLQCFVPHQQMLDGVGRSAIVSMATGLLALTLTLVVMGWLLYRDYSREIREASLQVSFVNQVSHELKTPLTNIRMYAELLERDLELVDEQNSARPRERLGIINSEAQRLSRLIGNVLTFARQKRKTLEPRPRETNVSELILHIVDRFQPSLAENGISAEVEGMTETTLSIDPDFVEQILGNLISNVEKYAASGNRLVVRCTASESGVAIDVIDAGPGIPDENREEIFRPFARLSNDLRTSTGTGIGLSIARDLARLHGGDVRLMDSHQGCWFRIDLASIKAG